MQIGKTNVKARVPPMTMETAARGATGDPQLATLTRERQDLVAEWQKRDVLRSAALGQGPAKRNPQAEVENNARLAAIDARIGEIDRELAARFPDYAALSSPAPLTAEEVQTQLGANEALVLFLDTEKWGATPEETNCGARLCGRGGWISQGRKIGHQHGFSRRRSHAVPAE